MKNESFGDAVFKYVNGLLLIVIAAIMIFPFLYIFSVSFSTLEDFIRKDIVLWPDRWDLSAYKHILSTKSFLKSLLFTSYITIIGTAVNLFFSTTMAYALTHQFIGKKLLLLIVMITILFSPGLIPSYIVVKELNLIDSIWALILPGAISSFNLIVIRQFYMNIPRELSEVATIDGANVWQIFTRIILPLSKPVLAAFGLFYAVGHWNNYFSAIIYINDSAKWPIQVWLRQIIIVDKPEMAVKASALMESPPPPETIQMAAILLATVPILLVYPFLQKYFAKGVMLGSVKG